MAEYPGGKGGSGVYQKIISLMPKHSVYYECFLGNGSILRYKKPAIKNIGIEIDAEVFNQLKNTFVNEFFQTHKSNNLIDALFSDDTPTKKLYYDKQGETNLFLYCTDAIQFLKDEFCFPQTDPKETLVYCDPPYLQSVRSSNRQIYRYDMLKDDEHIHLLETLNCLPCNVMISGYDSPLYNERLSDWRKVSFTGVSRGGARTEVVWMNFPEPLELHDYKFLGDDYRQRENIKRKKKRWINRLKKMNAQERYAFLSAFDELKFDQATAETPIGS